MAVFVSSAFPQGALGKGKGGGNQKETGSGNSGPGRDRTPPPTQGGNTGPSKDRDRTPPPTQGGNTGPSRDRDRTPPPAQGGGLGKGNGGGNTGPARDRDRDRTPPPTTGGSQGGGLDRGRGNSGGTGDLGRTRDTQTGGVKPTRGNENQGQLGRIDNPTQRGDSIRNGRQNETGRLGAPSYGTNNNQLGQISRDRNTTRVDRYEVPNLNKGSIASQAGRLGEARVNNRYRSGYYQYNNNWRDDYFYYPHYQFNYGNNCSVSPWYYYSNLPGYISYTRIVYVSNFSGIQWGIGSVYNWNRYNDNGWRNNDWRNDRYDSGLDDALDDIRRAWERGDKRAIGRLVPSRGRVNIYHDGRYSYSLNGDDFYDMLTDAVFSTDTDRYEIIDVRTSRDGAQIKARHTYTDGWGQRSTVIHSYRLVGDRYGYEIADFSTSYRNLW